MVNKSTRKLSWIYNNYIYLKKVVYIFFLIFLLTVNSWMFVESRPQVVWILMKYVTEYSSGYLNNNQFFFRSPQEMESFIPPGWKTRIREVFDVNKY